MIEKSDLEEGFASFGMTFELFTAGRSLKPYKNSFLTVVL